MAHSTGKLDNGSWRAAFSKDEILVSALRGESDGEHRNHLLISSFFNEPANIDLNISDFDTDPESGDDTEVFDTVQNIMLQELNSKTVKSLRDLCKQHNIRPGKRKKMDLALHIYQVLTNPERIPKRDTVLKELRKSFHTDASHHIFYRENFNAVDLHDRFWYSFNYNYIVKDWKQTYFFALFKMALINSWVIYNEKERVKLLEFLEEVSVWCLNPLKK